MTQKIKKQTDESMDRVNYLITLQHAGIVGMVTTDINNMSLLKKRY